MSFEFSPINSIDNCACCLSEISVPVRLGCSHLIDFHCIGEWVNEHNDICPLDRKKIDKISFENLNPSNTIALEFPRITFGPFYVSLDTPISTIATVYSVCKDKTLQGKLTKILGILNSSEFVSQEDHSALSFCGKFAVSEIEGIDITNIISSYYHGFQV